MKLKELNPKYKKLEIYKDKENPSLFEIPQIVNYDFSLSMYAENEVVYVEDLEDVERTKIILKY